MAMQRELKRAARLLGRRGGRATALRLSAEQRRENAKKAIAARWARYREQQQLALAGEGVTHGVA